MAALRAKSRKRLPSSAFAYPKQRKYPIHDLKHARAALSQAAKSNTFGSYRHVASAVKRRYKSKVATVGGPRGTVSRPGYRKASRRKRR